MEIVHVVPGGEYERYEELTLIKDQYEKEAELYHRAYIREFGELITESFQLKIACIALKKEIALCIKARNAGGSIADEEVKNILAQQMSGYYHELEAMIREKNANKAGRLLSNYETEQIKKLYRKLAKLLHPDISPLTADYPALGEYFLRILSAYKRNDLKELRKLEVLVNKELEANGVTGFEAVIPDVEERIEELERDIGLILHSEPYTYKQLLEDEAAAAAKKEALRTEIADYRAYRTELTKKRDEITGGDGYGGP